jgi:SAM-dependent methyltransferase
VKNLQLTARLWRSLNNRGIFGSLGHYALRAYRILRPHRLPPHPFDLKHGVHTTAHIPGSELGVGHAHDIYNTVYLPSQPSMVSSCIEVWQSFLTEADHPASHPIGDYTFVDLGCGMGRAVMVASLFPFRKVVGVEMNPKLGEQARSNLAIWQQTPRACNDLEIATCEATDFAWPKTPLAIYMFNPFEEPVVVALLERLDEALAEGSGPIDILYVYPVAAERLEAHPGAKLIARTHSYLSDEDRAVDPYNDPKAERYSIDFQISRLS